MTFVRLSAVFVLAVSLALPATAVASTVVTVPAATRVPLKFLATLDSSTAQQGQAVRFEVPSDVLVGRRVVVRRGASARGLVRSVEKAGAFGKNARIRIGFVQTTAVDGRPLALSNVDITPNNMRNVKDVGGAAGASAVGLVLLGPIGIAAGALVRGGHVQVPAGAVAIVATTSRARVAVR
ncbi:MAG: hypothetical protein ACT4P5_21000 [Armatimonadota bacterium]